MTNVADELGPVDWIVVEFPGGRFNREVAPYLVDLVERGMIRVLDLVLVRKDGDGSIEAYEMSDLDDSEVGQLRRYEAQLARVLGEDDVAAIAEAVEPDTSAAVLVFENSWAAPFGSAVRRSGGQLVASGRIPVQALLAAIDDRTDEQTLGSDMPHAARRARRSGVVGPARVARTATTVATAAVVAHGVNRRADQHDERRQRPV